MIALLQNLNRRLTRHASTLLLAGLIGVAGYNWRLWQRDKALADRLRAEQPPTPRLRRAPNVSALVAAWNERDRIEAHLRSFLALRYPDIELILCAGGSDGTLERARLYADERVLVLEQRPGEGKQRALARCLDHASGEIIYLTDADCLYDDQALARLLAPLIDGEEHAATGCSRPLDEQQGRLLPMYLWISDVMASARGSEYSSGILGRNAALTRQALDRIGGLAWEARTGTDYQLARRLLGADIAIRNVRTSVVASEYPATLRIYRHKQSRWLRNLLLHGRRYGAADDVRLTLQTVATGALMLAIPAAAWPLGRLILVPWSLLVAHAVGSKLRYAGFAARLYRRRLPLRLFAGLLPLTLIDFAIWASPILDLLHPKRRERW
ncbi:MAG TPA: glycosyltransferase family 2 protein [Herpetosiphonaceae bacterium]